MFSYTRRRVRRTGALVTTLLVLLVGAVRRPAAQTVPVHVLTQRYDAARSGVNLAEPVLTPSNVNTSQFGLLYSLGPVDGLTYAQPLYVSGLVVGGVARNVVFVATEHNSVYAFDADAGQAAPLWHVNLGPSAPQDPLNDPAHALVPDCSNLTPEVGITSTPVIDLAAGVIYVVAKTNEADGVHQRLSALALADGSVQRSVDISASNTAVTFGDTVVRFDPSLHLNRPGLLLSGGVVYLGFGSLCDYGPYHGWLLGFDAATLAPRASYVVTPVGEEGAIWQSGVGLTADAAGSIYAITSNGTFSSNGANLSDSVIRFTPTASGITPADFFTPANQDLLYADDFDFGASGAVLMPGGTRVIAAGKEGRVFLLDTAQLGGYDVNGDHVIQSFQATDVQYFNNIHGAPIFWNSPAGGRLFLWGENEPLKAFAYDGALFNPTPIAKSAVSAPQNAMPGGFLTLTANGSTPHTGVLWASIARDADATNAIVGGVLRAFDAEDITREVWNSDLDTRDDVGLFAKFVPPTVVNGKVFLATFSNAIRVYGLRSAVVSAPANPSPADGTANIGATVDLGWSATGAVSYDLKLGATNPPPLAASNLSAPTFHATALAAATTYYWQVTARSSSGVVDGPIWRFTTAGVSGALPAPWTDQDVGAVDAAGSAAFANGTFTVKGAGTIWGPADSFHFVDQPVSGDVTIVARVAGLQDTNTYAKAGIMLRESAAADSPHVILDVRPTGDLEFMTRSAAGAETTYLGTAFQPAPSWVRLVRRGTTVTAAVSADGSAWSTIGSVTYTGSSAGLAGLVVCSVAAQTVNTSTFDSVAVTADSGTPPPALPAPWSDQDVGAVDASGSASFANGVFTVAGAGTIWGPADSFHFVDQPVSGDVTIVARLTSLQNTSTYAKAGIMLRESTAPGSPHVILDVRPTGDLEFMTRSAAGAETTYLGTAFQSPPAWLRLVRVGNTVTAGVSADGTTWTTIGSVGYTGNASGLAGLVVCSVAAGTLNTSTFDNVAVTAGGGTPPPALPAPWTDQDVGAVDAPGSASFANGVFTVAGAGTIWGPADSFHFADEPVNGDVTIVARLTSVQNTNTFAKAGIMLRESTAPGSPHVILDVRPTGDLEFMTRSAAGVETTYLGTAFQPPPAWLRLVRRGTTVTASVSADGTTWTTVGSVTYTGNTAGLAGLVVCSVAPHTLNTSTFDNVTVTVP